MKIINVRIWDAETETMIYSDRCPGDYFFEFNNGKLRAYRIDECPVTDDDTLGRESVELTGEMMLCLNHKDMNGKLMYEGDITKSYHNGAISELRFGDFQEYDDGVEVWRLGFYWWSANLKYAKSFGLDIHDKSDQYEVLGNVYENPRLLSICNS